MTIYAIPVISSIVAAELHGDSSDKGSRILDAAARLFARYGVKKTAMDEIAREAGIAKGTLYLYYDSKEALFAGLAERLCAERERAVERAARGTGSIAERLVDMLDARVGASHRQLARSPHVAELTESKATLAAGIVAAHKRRIDQIFAEMLRESSIARDGAQRMLVAAAVGALHTGDTSQKAYRARLAELVETLLAGMARPH